MRRALAIVIPIVIAAVIVIGSGSGSATTFTVDAMFATAKGMVPGQLVKIAGARVGEVSAIDLVRTSGFGYEARMQLTMPRRFAPFHADASCQILPEGLISENFVECDPGSSSSPPLARGAGGVPTVPLAQTSAAVSLQDVFDIFTVPTDARMQLFLDTLGIGTAGRGADLNEIVREANPALVQAQRMLAILDTQKQQLTTAVGQTNAILTQLAARGNAVRTFVDNSAAVVRTTAEQRGALARTVARLPAMLEAARGGLKSLNRVAEQGPPLLTELRAAAPDLDELTETAPAFSAAAIPALHALDAAAARGRAAIPSALPVVRHLNAFAAAAKPVATLLDELLVSMRDKGGIEGLLRTLYGLATFSAPYSSVSHTAGLFFSLFPECIATNALNSPAAGCSHAYTAPDKGQAPANDPDINPGPNTADITPTGAKAALQGSSRGASAAQLRSLLEYLLK